MNGNGGERKLLKTLKQGKEIKGEYIIISKLMM